MNSYLPTLGSKVKKKLSRPESLASSNRTDRSAGVSTRFMYVEVDKVRMAANACGLQSKLSFLTGKPHLKNPFNVVMMLTWLNAAC